MARLIIEKSAPVRSSWRLPVRISSKEKARSLRQLATLVQMRIPLEQALTLVAKQLQNARLKTIYGQCRDAVRNGDSLTTAMKRHPAVFGETVQHFVMVGEMTGNLGDTLDQAAMQMEKVVALKRKMITALSYPAIVMLVAIGAVAFLLTVVVPTFNEVFKDFGGELPMMTRILIAGADLFGRRWYVLILSVIALGWLLSRLWRGSRSRIIMERCLFRFPVLGSVLFKTHLARMIRTLCTLLANGIQLVVALPASGEASGSLLLNQASQRMNTEIKRGLALCRAFENEKPFPSLVSQMTEIGEQSGSLAAMMQKTADYYEQEIDAAIENLNAVLEPLLIVGLGIVLGGILIALYMQIFSIVDAVG
jgi:type IV pilus assembly protein PilC